MPFRRTASLTGYSNTSDPPTQPQPSPLSKVYLPSHPRPTQNIPPPTTTHPHLIIKKSANPHPPKIYLHTPPPIHTHPYKISTNLSNSKYTPTHPYWLIKDVVHAPPLSQNNPSPSPPALTPTHKKYPFTPTQPKYAVTHPHPLIKKDPSTPTKNIPSPKYIPPTNKKSPLCPHTQNITPTTRTHQ